MPSINVFKFKSHYSLLIFKQINIFSDWCIMPDDIPGKNTVNEPPGEGCAGTRSKENNI